METNTKLTLVVSLRINPGRETEFEQFESAATKIMGRYGGVIERRIRLTQTASAPPVTLSETKARPEATEGNPPRLSASSGEIGPPDEIHIVTFPDAASFDRYRADPDLIPLAELRTRAIASTIVWPATNLPLFLSF